MMMSSSLIGWFTERHHDGSHGKQLVEINQVKHVEKVKQFSSLGKNMKSAYIPFTAWSGTFLHMVCYLRCCCSVVVVHYNCRTFVTVQVHIALARKWTGVCTFCGCKYEGVRNMTTKWGIGGIGPLYSSLAYTGFAFEGRQWCLRFMVCQFHVSCTYISLLNYSKGNSVFNSMTPLGLFRLTGNGLSSQLARYRGTPVTAMGI